MAIIRGNSEVKAGVSSIATSLQPKFVRLNNSGRAIYSYKNEVTISTGGARPTICTYYVFEPTEVSSLLIGSVAVLIRRVTTRINRVEVYQLEIGSIVYKYIDSTTLPTEQLPYTIDRLWYEPVARISDVDLTAEQAELDWINVQPITPE